MFSLMCIEYTAVSNKQRLFMCVRWIIASDTIVSAIKDSLSRFNLPLYDLRVQSYDHASNMLGKRSGMAAQIKRV